MTTHHIGIVHKTRIIGGGGVGREKKSEIVDMFVFLLFVRAELDWTCSLPDFHPPLGTWNDIRTGSWRWHKAVSQRSLFEPSASFLFLVWEVDMNQGNKFLQMSAHSHCTSTFSSFKNNVVLSATTGLDLIKRQSRPLFSKSTWVVYITLWMLMLRQAVRQLWPSPPAAVMKYCVHAEAFWRVKNKNLLDS